MRLQVRRLGMGSPTMTQYNPRVKTTAPPDPHTRKPKVKPPPLACDAHCHVFGPASKFPYAADAPFWESNEP
jgi:2-pyrone-4,6-dicarboxylate lactonase